MFNMGCENECRFYCQLHFIPWSKYRGRLNTIDPLLNTTIPRRSLHPLFRRSRAHTFKRPISPYRLPIVPDDCRSISNQTRETPYPWKQDRRHDFTSPNHTQSNRTHSRARWRITTPPRRNQIFIGTGFHPFSRF